MELDKLCEQKRVDNLFIPIKKKFPKLKEEIEQIEFLFKNSIYNKNRMLEELERSNEGFEFQNNTFSFEMKIPIIVWQDIIGFEFQSCLYNLIRTINYILKFKLQQLDKKELKKYPSFATYVFSNKKDENLFDLFSKNYYEWVLPINEIRNKLTHKFLVKKFQGFLFMKQNISKEGIEREGKVEVGCQEYGCLNFEDFVEDKIKKLEKFIQEFFIKFGEHYEK